MKGASEAKPRVGYCQRENFENEGFPVMPWRGQIERSFNCDFGLSQQPFIGDVLCHAEAKDRLKGKFRYFDLLWYGVSAQWFLTKCPLETTWKFFKNQGPTNLN